MAEKNVSFGDGMVFDLAAATSEHAEWVIGQCDHPKCKQNSLDKPNCIKMSASKQWNNSSLKLSNSGIYFTAMVNPFS